MNLFHIYRFIDNDVIVMKFDWKADLFSSLWLTHSQDYPHSLCRELSVWRWDWTDAAGPSGASSAAAEAQPFLKNKFKSFHLSPLRQLPSPEIHGEERVSGRCLFLFHLSLPQVTERSESAVAVFGVRRAYWCLRCRWGSLLDLLALIKEPPPLHVFS